jgi:hypothetical protein
MSKTSATPSPLGAIARGVAAGAKDLAAHLVYGLATASALRLLAPPTQTDDRRSP